MHNNSYLLGLSSMAFLLLKKKHWVKKKIKYNVKPKWNKE